MPAAPSNLMSFPGDEEMLLIWQGPGGGGGGGGTEGDKIENPFVVTGLPFYAKGLQRVLRMTMMLSVLIQVLPLQMLFI